MKPYDPVVDWELLCIGIMFNRAYHHGLSLNVLKRNITVAHRIDLRRRGRQTGRASDKLSQGGGFDRRVVDGRPPCDRISMCMCIPNGGLLLFLLLKETLTLQHTMSSQCNDRNGSPSGA